MLTLVCRACTDCVVCRLGKGEGIWGNSQKTSTDLMHLTFFIIYYQQVVLWFSILFIHFGKKKKKKLFTLMIQLKADIISTGESNHSAVNNLQSKNYSPKLTPAWWDLFSYVIKNNFKNINFSLDILPKLSQFARFPSKASSFLAEHPPLHGLVPRNTKEGKPLSWALWTRGHGQPPSVTHCQKLMQIFLLQSLKWHKTNDLFLSGCFTRRVSPHYKCLKTTSAARAELRCTLCKLFLS